MPHSWLAWEAFNVIHIILEERRGEGREEEEAERWEEKRGGGGGRGVGGILVNQPFLSQSLIFITLVILYEIIIVVTGCQKL